MNIEVRELTDTKAELVIDGTSHAVLNALRRSLITDVPKLSIDDVTIYDNTSGLFDEMIAHRLGLLPIPTDLQAYVPRELQAEGGEEDYGNVVLFTLSKEGPCTVYSGDLTPTDNQYRIRDPKIPIVKLLEGQRLMLEAQAVFGLAHEHSKWSPVSGAGYLEYPEIEIPEGAISPTTYGALQRTAPEGALAFEDGKVRVLDPERAYFFLRSAKNVYDLDNVRITERQDKFIFRFETDGSIFAKDAFLYALRLLMDNLKQVEQEAPKLKEAEAETAA